MVFDVDHLDKAPELLAKHLGQAPHQSSRRDDPGRGHYLFLQPEHGIIGNSTGQLGGDWGEVRGNNGVIIAAPSTHTEGGFYQWQRTGPVPPLPDELDEALPTGTPGEAAATDAQVAKFLREHNSSQRPEVLHGFKQALLKKIEARESRHVSAVSVVTGAFKEARAGYYPAQAAVDMLKPILVNAVQLEPRKRTAVQLAATEWNGIVAWASHQQTPPTSGRSANELRTCPTTSSGSTPSPPTTPRPAMST